MRKTVLLYNNYLWEAYTSTNTQIPHSTANMPISDELTLGIFECDSAETCLGAGAGVTKGNVNA